MKVIGDGLLYCLLVVFLPKSFQMMLLPRVVF